MSWFKRKEKLPAWALSALEKVMGSPITENERNGGREQAGAAILKTVAISRGEPQETKQREMAALDDGSLPDWVKYERRLVEDCGWIGNYSARPNRFEHLSFSTMQDPNTMTKHVGVFVQVRGEMLTFREEAIGFPTAAFVAKMKLLGEVAQ